MNTGLHRLLLITHWLVFMLFVGVWGIGIVGMFIGNRSVDEIFGILLVWNGPLLPPLVAWVFPLVIIGIQWIVNGRLMLFPWDRK